ncbi:MAG TPA: type IV pilus secretin PilQ [Verrucomicrobiae bacterium]|jgi:type IV pilus secretin PilQ/predicted competence protein|nr:type IV pilus secretin PilQ [Verrucomicrobiae bacterium]
MKFLPIRHFLRLAALETLAGLALLGVLSCAPAVQEEPAANARPTRSAEADNRAREDTAPTVAVKESPLQEQSFHVQNLSVAEERGQTTLRIKFSTPVAQYRHFVLMQPARIVLDVFGPVNAMPDVETFRSETNWLSVLRLSSGAGNLRLVMEIAAAEAPAYVIEPDSSGLKVVLGQIDPKRTAKKDLLLVQNGRRVDSVGAQARATATAAQAPAAAQDVKAAAPATRGPKVYTGQKISLDFKDADIKNVFRLLAEVSGLNIVVTDEVKKRVTVRLVDVPWDQALDLLVDTNGLGKEQMGNVVRISTAGQMKKERDDLLAAQKAQDSLEPLQTAYLSVNYARVKELVDKIKPVLSPRGVVLPDERSNTILVRDIRKGVEEANEIASRLDTRTPQVLIESNLIETTPTFARSLGVDLGFSKGGATIDSNAAAGSPFVASPAENALGLALSIVQHRFAGFKDINLKLTAAESEGKVRVLSRPSVVTLNNVASTIQSLQIVRVALPSGTTNIASGTGSAAGSAVATEKIPVGIVLTVTPQVSSDGFVLLNVNVKSSTLGTRSLGAQIPDELSREAIANVLLRDGETLVLGGIMRDTKNYSESGVPWFKDIPVLGWLFKTTTNRVEFSELMVFVTPRIIASGSQNLPTAEDLWRDRLRQTEGS